MDSKLKPERVAATGPSQSFTRGKTPGSIQRLLQTKVPEIERAGELICETLGMATKYFAETAAALPTHNTSPRNWLADTNRNDAPGRHCLNNRYVNAHRAEQRYGMNSFARQIEARALLSLLIALSPAVYLQMSSRRQSPRKSAAARASPDRGDR